MASRNNIQKKQNGIGLRAGTAVAAALLLINGGIAYKVLSGASKPENIPAASSSVSVGAPVYVQRMQEYFTKMNNTPCNFDFTGMGEDVSMIWESDEWKVELKAVTGCDSLLYFFYDVTPKQGQTQEDMNTRWPSLHLSLGEDMEKTMVSYYSALLPAEDGASVYHGYSIAKPAGGGGLAGQNVSVLCVGVTKNADDTIGSTAEDIVPGEDGNVALDFLPETPVEDLKEAFGYSVAEGETEHATGVKVSPFGLYFSDSFFADINRADVQPDSTGNINSLYVRAVMKDGSEKDVQLMNETYFEKFTYTDQDGEARSINNVNVLFAEPAALYNVRCFVVSCDGVEGTCTIPVAAEDPNNPENQRPDKEDSTGTKESYIISADLTDEEYAQLSDAQKAAYDEVKNYWQADYGFMLYSGFEYGSPQHQTPIEDGGTVRCGNLMDTEYWVYVEQFTELDHACPATICLMYNGETIPTVAADGEKPEYKNDCVFECGEGTGVTLPFDLTNVPDGAELTLEVYFTPNTPVREDRSGKAEGPDHYITVLSTRTFTYEKMTEGQTAAAACEDLYNMVNFLLTDMEAAGEDLSQIEGSYYCTADEHRLENSTAAHIENWIVGYGWDRLHQFPAFGFTIDADHTCTDAYVEFSGGTVHKSDQVDPTVLNDVQDHLQTN